MGPLVLLKCIHILALHHGIKHTDTHVAFPAVHILQNYWWMQNAREISENSQELPPVSSLCGLFLVFANKIPATHLWPAWHSSCLCFNSLVDDFIILIWSPDHLQITTAL